MKTVLIALAGAGALLLLCALATWLMARNIEARFPPDGRFVEVEGGRLHYVEAAPANPKATVVFLHGASSSHADAMMLGKRLADRFRVIALDRPGHGWSDRVGGAAAASPARQADVIAQALRKLNVRAAVVVGHSWAGAVVPNLALDHSDLVAATVYLAPVTHPWPGGRIAWYYAPAADSWFGWLMTRTVATPFGALALDAVVRAVFAPQGPPAGYTDEAQVPLALRPPVFAANAQDVAGLFAAVTEQHARYGKIRVPTVIIAGDADAIVWTEVHSRALAREVEGARLLVLPGVGHMPHHGRPDLVLAEIERLAANAAAAAP